MEKFTEIEEYLDGCGSEFERDLRQYILHDRDQELGRWRHKDYPEYVVYPKQEAVTESEPGVRVVNEITGRSKDIGRKVIGACEAVVSRYGKVAQSYFEAHPESKPWLDAKPGEVWLITCGLGAYEDVPAVVARDRKFYFEGYFASHADSIAVADVSKAERIYPND